MTGLVLGLAVFVAGGLGALARAAVDTRVARAWRARVSGPMRAFPASTFLINVSGAFVLGVVAGIAIAHDVAGARHLAAILGVGFIGAYTTFSTEEWQTLGLLRTNAGVEALNIIGSLAASMLLAALGLWLGGLTR